MKLPWSEDNKIIETEYNEVELTAMLADKLGDIDIVDITKDGVKEIFSAMSGIDGILDYLKDTMANDLKRYFAAQTDKERDMIRGAFARTSYLRAACLDSLGKS